MKKMVFIVALMLVPLMLTGCTEELEDLSNDVKMLLCL